MEGRRRAIVINEADNVATALEPLGRGSRVKVERGGILLEITLGSDIPPGHKFALKGLEAGERVIKYGEPIGRCVAAVAEGEHVHVHNVESGPDRGAQ